MPILRTSNGRVAAIAPAMSVRRILPAAAQRSVGPFIFLDHFGPMQLSPRANADVGPHPHIGLATVTYLLDGEMIHRDSIGTVQAILPGDINLMTAGSGVVHSERVPEALRRHGGRLEGLQLWAALPQEQEDDAPSFQHVDRSDLPEVDLGGAQVRILIGSAFGETSPVAASSRTLYLDLAMSAGGTCELAVAERQLAVYSPDGRTIIDGVPLDPHTMAVISPDSPARVSCEADCRLIVIGGDPLPEPVHMWWNFVSTQTERIARAADRWRIRQFPVIAGETDLATMPTFSRPSRQRAGR